MLINLSNHPSSEWSEKQMNEAIRYYYSVQDFAFPKIEPTWTTEQILDFAQSVYNEVINLKSHYNGNFAVHIMGEFTFVYALIRLLQKTGIECIASTTSRNVTIDKDGKKITEFGFVKFRKYPVL